MKRVCAPKVDPWCAPSSPVRERETERERDKEIKRERKREGERERESRKCGHALSVPHSVSQSACVIFILNKIIDRLLIGTARQ